jgi:dolichyldiphosphatase
MVFFAIYLTCLATFNFKFSADYVRKVTIGLPWALAPLVMYSRVYLGYHSVTQVLAGASLGVVLGSSWFWCVHRYFHPKFQQLEKSKFCRFFRIRDSSHIPDIIGFEYKVSQKMRSLAQFRQRPHRRPQPRCHRCRRATWD